MPRLVGEEGPDLVHVGAHVAGQREGRAPADRARGRVEEGQRDRQAGLLGDPVEAGLPVVALAAGALGRDAEQEGLVGLGVGEQRPDRRRRGSRGRARPRRRPA